MTQEQRFRAAMDALSDAGTTEIVLVTRPDRAAVAEVACSAGELAALGLANQRLAVNGIFHASDPNDPVAQTVERTGQAALAEMPEPLRRLPRDDVPLRGFDMVGLPALRAQLGTDAAPVGLADTPSASATLFVTGLDAPVDGFAAREHGLVMVMDKGGVGKTTIAAALAVGLVTHGHALHLSTNDPAAHLAMTLCGEMPGLRVDRIAPKVETERYVAKIMNNRGRDLDEAGREAAALRAPCLGGQPRLGWQRRLGSTAAPAHGGRGSADQPAEGRPRSAALRRKRRWACQRYGGSQRSVSRD
jgi:arsenite-transporting ATPase